MGIIIRQGLKSTIVSYVGVVIGAFNLMWLFPKFLSPEEIGLTNLIPSIGAVLAVFAQIGAANIIDKFFSVFKTEDRKHNGFLTLVLIYPLFGFLLLTIVLLLFKDFWLSFYQEKSPAVNEYFYYIIPFTFFLVYQGILEAYCRAHFRIVVPGIFREIGLRTFTLAFVLLYYFKFITFYQLILLIIASYGIIVIFLLAYIHNLKALHLKWKSDILNIKLLKSIGIYGGFILLGGAGAVITNKVDSLMIPMLLGNQDLGIYTIAFFMGTIIEIPRRSLSQISTPIVAAAWLNNDLDKIDELYKKSSINQFLIAAFLFLLIWCNVDAFFNLIPKRDIYVQGKYVVFFIGLARVIDMVTGINGEIILQSQYYRFNLISIAFLAALLVVTNYIFIPIAGINGAAFATMLSFLLYNLLKFSFLWLKFRMQPFSKKTLIISLSAGLAFLAAYFIPMSDLDPISTIINIIIRSAAISVVYLLLCYFFKVSEEANQLVHTAWEAIRNKFITK